MATGTLHHTKITAVACAVPPTERYSESFVDMVGEDGVKKFIETVGMLKGHVSEGRMTTSDLCYAAADRLLTSRVIDRSSIDGLIFVSQTPDYIAPSTACLLQHRLGLSTECLAYDVNLACSGYVYGLVQAMSLLQATGLQRILLLAGDTVSAHCSPQDRGLTMLSTDAGTATLIERDENAAPARFILNTIGSGFKSLIVPYGGYRHRFGAVERTEREPGVIRSDYDGYMDGAEVFRFSITHVPKLFKAFYERFDTSPADFDRFFLHQANLYIIKNILKRVGAPLEKAPISIDRYGNTGAATIPLTICDHYPRQAGRETERALLAGFGIGLSLGVVALEIDPTGVLPIFVSSDAFDDDIESLHRETSSLVRGEG